MSMPKPMNRDPNSMFPAKPSHKRYMPAETVMAQIPPMITSGIILNICLILVTVPNTHHRIPNHPITNLASFCSTKKPASEYSAAAVGFSVKVYSDRGKRIGPVFSSVEKAQDYLSRRCFIFLTI